MPRNRCGQASDQTGTSCPWHSVVSDFPVLEGLCDPHQLWAAGLTKEAWPEGPAGLLAGWPAVHSVDAQGDRDLGSTLRSSGICPLSQIVLSSSHLPQFIITTSFVVCLSTRLQPPKARGLYSHAWHLGGTQELNGWVTVLWN